VGWNRRSDHSASLWRRGRQHCRRGTEQYDLGSVGNSIVGVIGGGVGAQIIGALVGGGGEGAAVAGAGAWTSARSSVRSFPAVSAAAS